MKKEKNSNYNKKNVDIMLVIVALLSILGLWGAFSFPFIISELSIDFPSWVSETVGKKIVLWLAEKGGIPVGPQHLFDIVINLFLSQEIFIGLAIGLFSIILPISKILIILILSLPFDVLNGKRRLKLILFMSYISKWSMADVFIIGMLIVFIKAEGFHFVFKAGIGIYCFSAAAILSSIAYHFITHSEIE